MLEHHQITINKVESSLLLTPGNKPTPITICCDQYILGTGSGDNYQKGCWQTPGSIQRTCICHFFLNFRSLSSKAIPWMSSCKPWRLWIQGEQQYSLQDTFNYLNPSWNSSHKAAVNWKHYKRGVWQWQRYNIVATAQKIYMLSNGNPQQTQIFTWDYMKTLWKWKCLDAFSCNKSNCLQVRWYSVTTGGKFGNTDYYQFY